MKGHLKHIIPLPPFARVYSPANILEFVDKHGYPVIVKPILGSASAGLDVLRSRDDLNIYCREKFYARIDEDGRCMDYSGDMIIEKFLEVCLSPRNISSPLPSFPPPCSFLFFFFFFS